MHRKGLDSGLTFSDPAGLPRARDDPLITPTWRARVPHPPASILERVSNVVLAGEEFVRIVHAAAKAASATDYRLRRGDDLKYLFDELLPLAAFVRAAETLEREIAVRYVRGSQSYDAELTLAGPEVDKGLSPATLWTEVTVARHPKDYLHREALETTGAVFPGNKIRRVKAKGKPSTIENEAEAMDGDAPITDAAEWVRDAMLAKHKIEYPQPALLVISAEPMRYPSIVEWGRLGDIVAHSRDGDRFKYVAVVHWPTHMMFWV